MGQLFLILAALGGVASGGLILSGRSRSDSTDLENSGQNDGRDAAEGGATAGLEQPDEQVFAEPSEPGVKSPVPAAQKADTPVPSQQAKPVMTDTAPDTKDPVPVKNTAPDTKDPVPVKNTAPDTKDPVPVKNTAPDTTPKPVQPTPPDVQAEGPVVDVAGANTIGVLGGRVTTLEVGEADDILSVRVLEKPDVGNLTANPDKTLGLVLSDASANSFSGSLDFSYEIAYKDGSSETVVQTVEVAPSRQLDGWGEGDFYMLETDDAGELIIEHGDNHREVYVTGNDLALSREEIAEIEGMRVGQVNGKWLAQSDYGRSPDTALDAAAGRELWSELTGADAEPGSHWLLFEKGYEYGAGRLIEQGSQGESELHPLYVGSYGEGDLPILKGDLRIFQKSSENIVFRDIAIGEDFQTLEGGNFILDGIDNNDFEIAFQAKGAHTLRDSTVTDSHDQEASRSDIWEPNMDRVQGLFVNYSQGVLLENNFFDLNGWELDYQYDASADAGQAPSMFNHNIYVSHSAGDVTVRDNIILRGASFGAQVRPGGFVEDNVFAGNNIGVNFLGGNSVGDGTRTGNFTLFADNVVTSGGFNTVEIFQGATTWAVDAAGLKSTLSDNIITHLVEPGEALDAHPDYNDTQKTLAIVNPNENRIYYDDTIVYNWALPDGNKNAPDANIDGLNTNKLDQTTIENFTADLLSQTDGSVADLAGYLREQTENGSIDPVDADRIIEYFQDGFGISEGGDRSQADTLRFAPNSLGDGIRWDNRLNWSTDDLPGTADGDNVNLAGNWVVYGGTTTVNDLDLGSGGQLLVTHGYLQVDGSLETGSTGGAIGIDNAGQLWVDGYSDKDLLRVEVDGGRFANTGLVDGRINLEVDDNAQAILATAGAEMELNGGSRLTVIGSDADVGFDGETGGKAALNIETDSYIAFVADDEGFSDISEFRSGHYDEDAPDVASEINLSGGTLGIDLSGLKGAAVQETLLAADTIQGGFDVIELFGLEDDQDAMITFDYDRDEVSIDITERGAGTGLSDIQFVGEDAGAQLMASLMIDDMEEPIMPEEMDEFSDSAFLLG